MVRTPFKTLNIGDRFAIGHKLYIKIETVCIVGWM